MCSSDLEEYSIVCICHILYIHSSVNIFHLLAIKNDGAIGTSLVAQWLGIHLPMQGTRVQSLVLEDPTCHTATKPVCRNY